MPKSYWGRESYRRRHWEIDWSTDPLVAIPLQLLQERAISQEVLCAFWDLSCWLREQWGEWEWYFHKEKTKEERKSHECWIRDGILLVVSSSGWTTRTHTGLFCVDHVTAISARAVVRKRKMASNSKQGVGGCGKDKDSKAGREITPDEPSHFSNQLPIQLFNKYCFRCGSVYLWITLVIGADESIRISFFSSFFGINLGDCPNSFSFSDVARGLLGYICSEYLIYGENEPNRNKMNWAKMWKSSTHTHFCGS